MSFQPVIPLTGYTGWRFLVQTEASQKAAYTESAPVSRSTTYFRENIGTVQTVDDLLKDRRLLEVALGAFGLGEDINNTAFIRKVLTEGTTTDGAFATRLADKRYEAFSKAFGFGDQGARTALSSFPDEIVGRYETLQFEVAVGEQNSDLRQALGLEQGLSDVIAQSSSANAQWYSIMGNEALRDMFELALGLPEGFGSIDIDQQLVTFKERAKATFGTDQVTEIASPENQEKLIRLFLVRSEAAASASTSSQSIALQLLQSE
jgi:hypothetical protein